jgi:hypothetical protein
LDFFDGLAINVHSGVLLKVKVGVCNLQFLIIKDS